MLRRLFQLLIAAHLLVLMSNRVLAEGPPPQTWREHWFDHQQVLNLVYYDDDVAVYYDADVDRNITWIFKFVGDVWRYTKRVYGDFGGQSRLYAVFHSDKYYGGHPSTWWDASHDYRNVIDIGKPGDWYDASGWNLGVITHEVSHIVELGSKQVHGSPAFGLWMDSKWAEIFNYDVLLKLGLGDAARDNLQSSLKNVDNAPQMNTHWFRDWFYPIYSKYGGTRVLNRYFELLSQYFPKNGRQYARDMNWGEFVHFWSVAAGADLKDQARLAFGWSDAWEKQLIRARSDFRMGAVPTPVPVPTPTPVPIVTPKPTPSTGGQCRGTGDYASLPNIDQWCTDNCKVGNCPVTHCLCD